TQVAAGLPPPTRAGRLCPCVHARAFALRGASSATTSVGGVTAPTGGCEPASPERPCPVAPERSRPNGRARTVARHLARPGTSADLGATPRPPHPKREPTGCLRTATRGARPGRPFLTRRSTMNPTIDPTIDSTMDPPTFPLPDERGRFGPYGG